MDISLLPEQLREREKKEMGERESKQVGEVKFVEPPKEPKEEKSPQEEKPEFFKRLWQKFVNLKKILPERKNKKEIKKEKPTLAVKEKVGRFVGVNLAPEELAVSEEKTQKEWLFSGGAILISLLIVGLAWLALSWYQLGLAKQAQKIDQEIILVDQRINNLSINEKEIAYLQKRLKTITDLLEKHVYWTKFFIFLEQYTIPDVYYNNLAVTAKDRISLMAIGRNFGAVARQILSFEEATDYIQEVSVTTASLKKETMGIKDKVDFNISLILKPEVFIKILE